MEIKLVSDHGLTYDKTGPANGGHTNLELATDVAGDAFQVGPVEVLEGIPALATFDPATALTGIDVKLQGQGADGAWRDVYTTKDDGTTAQKHTLTAAAPALVLRLVRRTTFSAFRWVATAAGGATKAGDRLRVWTRSVAG